MIAASFALQISVVSASDSSRFWPGWYVGILTSESSSSDVESLLESAGISGWVSAGNTLIPYMAMPDLEYADIDTINSLLLQGDPRRDSWIAGIERLFRTGDGDEVIYLPTGHSIRYYEKLLPGIVIADRTTRGGFLAVAVYLAAVAAVLLARRSSLRLRFLSMAAALIWTPYLFAAPIEVLPFVFAAMSAVMLLPGREWIRQVGCSVIVVAVALPLVSGFAFGGSMIAAMAGTAASLLLIFILPRSGSDKPEDSALKRDQPKAVRTARSRRTRGKDHKLFEPVSLLAPLSRRQPTVTVHTLRSVLPQAAAILLTAGLSIVLAFGVNAGPDDTVVPSIADPLSGFDSFASVRSLEDGHDASSLPDFASMLASWVHQEGFMYGAAADIPMPGETLSITDYVEVGGILHSVEKDIVTYDSDWLDSTVEIIGAQGAGRLLVSAGGPAEVFLADVSVPIGSGIPGVAPVWFLIFAMTLFAVASLIPARKVRVFRGSYFTLYTVRRRAKAA